MDETTRTKIEAAVFRRLVEHFQTHTEVQNIDVMNTALFCRNCLSKWYKEAANELGHAVALDDARSTIYGMPYDEWKRRHQK